MSSEERGSHAPVEVQDGSNNRFLELVTSAMALPKIDLYNAEEVRGRIIQWFQMCAERDMKPGVANTALALGISREDFGKIARSHPSTANYPPECRVLFQEAYSGLNALWENWMLNGKLNPASGIFLGKNDFGYVDVVNHEVAVSDRPSLEAIEGKYAEIPE